MRDNIEEPLRPADDGSLDFKSLTLMPNFPTPVDVGPREWGREELLVLSSGKYTLKRITLLKGMKGGLQYHRFKDEAGYLISGEMLVRYNGGNGGLLCKTLLPGQSFHFAPGVIHQTEAVTDCIYIEASTPHFNDRVHVETAFGLARESGGLPSTRADEVILK